MVLKVTIEIGFAANEYLITYRTVAGNSAGIDAKPVTGSSSFDNYLQCTGISKPFAYVDPINTISGFLP